MKRLACALIFSLSVSAIFTGLAGADGGATVIGPTVTSPTLIFSIEDPNENRLTSTIIKFGP